MSAIASIHFKKSTEHNIVHNDRTQAPSYLLEHGGQGVIFDRNNEQAKEYLKSLLDTASANYKKRTHQKIQAKSIFWSAVVNIKEDTTLDDLKKLSQHFKEKYGIQCYQIAIHRDEGHIDKDTKEVKINQHAHLEFLTLDENGINKFRREHITKKLLSQMQTETAQILGMERGEVNSKTKRLEHAEYKRLMREKGEQKSRDKKTQKLTKTAIKARIEKERKDWKNKNVSAHDFRALSALKNLSFDSSAELEKAIYEITPKHLKTEFNETQIQEIGHVRDIEDIRATEDIKHTAELNSNAVRNVLVLRIDQEQIRDSKDLHEAQQVCSADESDGMQYLRAEIDTLHEQEYLRLIEIKEQENEKLRQKLENERKVFLTSFKKSHASFWNNNEKSLDEKFALLSKSYNDEIDTIKETNRSLKKQNENILQELSVMRLNSLKNDVTLLRRDNVRLKEENANLKELDGLNAILKNENNLLKATIKEIYTDLKKIWISKDWMKLMDTLSKIKQAFFPNEKTAQQTQTHSSKLRR